MGNILLLFLVLFPMLLSAWVFPLRRRDREWEAHRDPHGRKREFYVLKALPY